MRSATSSPIAIAITCAFAVLIGLFATCAGGAVSYRNFNLPCLAPLLEQVDPEAPATIELAFLRGPTRAPALMENIGAVEFPITTPSPEAAAFFNQGVALLHGLSYKEAERSFRQALAHDEHNPMILWGLSVANEPRPQRARLFAQNAVRRIRNETTQRERLWIDALARFYNVERGGPAKLPPAEKLTEEEIEQRHRRRIRDLEAITLAFPDDVEAKAFLLRQLTLDEHRSGFPITSHVGVDALAQKLTEIAPAHPSRHYRIFLWLSDNPPYAIAPATESAAFAPALADSWRYAAEAWSGNGLHHHAVPLLETALRADHRRMHDQLLMPSETENLVSNYAALVDTLASMGRVGEALKWAQRMIALPRDLDPEAASSAAADRWSFSATGKRLVAQALLRAELPERLLEQLETTPSLQPRDRVPRERAHWLYWKAVALASLDRFDEIEPLHQQLSSLSKAADSAETQKEISELIAGLEVFRGLRSGVVPSDSSPDPPFVPAVALARAWEKAGDREKATDLLRRELAGRPGQLLAIATLCEINFAAGEFVPAMAAFDRTFRTNASRADGGIPVLDRLGPLAAAMKLPKNWKIPPTRLEVPGMPADIESIGPETWAPAPAPSWSLPVHTGRTISLDEFRGEPVLLNFFLGVGCIYCVEQLKKFQPYIDDFNAAGISMVAISTDSVEILAAALGDTEEKTPEARERFPYPIVADPEYSTFRAYGVFDDFEDGPMHATYLIGPRGRVLWKNISHGPFNHPESLLEEAKRLLEQHADTGKSGEEKKQPPVREN